LVWSVHYKIKGNVYSVQCTDTAFHTTTSFHTNRNFFAILLLSTQDFFCHGKAYSSMSQQIFQNNSMFVSHSGIFAVSSKPFLALCRLLSRLSHQIAINRAKSSTYMLILIYLRTFLSKTQKGFDQNCMLCARMKLMRRGVLPTITHQVLG